MVLVCMSNAVYATHRDTTQRFPLYQECTHPGKYEPIGVLASCCTGKGDWTFSYAYMDMYYKGNKMGTEKVSDGIVYQQDAYMMSPGIMNMQTHMLMGMYGISNRFSTTLILNYNMNNMTMHPMPADLMNTLTGMTMGSIYMPSSSHASGIGDSKIYVMYKLRQECRYNVIVSGGLSIPTASTTINGVTMMGVNQRLPYLMQLGTGTWDLMPGITYFGQRNVSAVHLLSYGAEAGAVIRPANNARGYSYGNQYNITAWVSLKFHQWISCSARLQASSQGKITGFDPAIYPLMYYDPGSNPGNYGGQSAVAYLGVNFYINKGSIKDLRLLAEYGAPVYQNLHGTQLSLYGTLQAGVKYSF